MVLGFVPRKQGAVAVTQVSDAVGTYSYRESLPWLASNSVSFVISIPGRVTWKYSKIMLHISDSAWKGTEISFRDRSMRSSTLIIKQSANARINKPFLIQSTWLFLNPIK